VSKPGPDRILVTGASGFIGGSLLSLLARDVHLLPRAAVRLNEADLNLPVGVERVPVGDLAADTNWMEALRRIDTIVHTAARVHIMRDDAPEPLVEFRRVNVDGTWNLARQAAESGVRRFIFISSIKVNGEGTELGKPYRADDIPAPADAYGISKHEAEQGLQQVARATGMEVVIIRPVLVYGPGVKANFHTMMRWLHKGIPLPLGVTQNRRSFVALENLLHLIVTCIQHPAAADQTFLVSDGEDLSTAELLRRTAAAMGVRARLLPVPAPVLLVAARFLGKVDLAQRLCGTLQVDIGATRELLGWAPPVSADQALRRTALHFLANLPMSLPVQP